MQRIDDPSNVPAKPAPLATVSPGFFRRPSVLAGDQGTIVTADFLNDIQETIVNPIISSGGVLSKGSSGLLTAAINSLANSRIATHNAIASSEGVAAHARFATSIEVLAQALGTVAISPLRLRQAFPSSLANPGYIQLPTLLGNALIQFGTNDLASGTTSFDVAYPVPFPTGPLVVVGSGRLGGTGETGETGTAWIHPSTPLTHVRLGIGGGPAPGTVGWVAIGR